MKRFKKPKGGTITLSVKDLKKIKEEVTDTAVGTATLVYLVATKDEFDMSLEDLIKIFVRANRYGKYLDDKVVEMKQLADSLEKDTGIRIKWR